MFVWFEAALTTDGHFTLAEGPAPVRRGHPLRRAVQARSASGPMAAARAIGRTATGSKLVRPRPGSAPSSSSTGRPTPSTSGGTTWNARRSPAAPASTRDLPCRHSTGSGSAGGCTTSLSRRRYQAADCDFLAAAGRGPYPRAGLVAAVTSRGAPFDRCGAPARRVRRLVALLLDRRCLADIWPDSVQRCAASNRSLRDPDRVRRRILS
jgi:hypothetical protein